MIDVIIIGAGGGGAVVAKELGEKGIKVLVLEAGPWYGNDKWPKPNEEQGGISCSSDKNLSKKILDKCFTDLEGDMNDTISGKLRWGPANREESPWFRRTTRGGFVWQSSGVGGTTIKYFGNSPRAFPLSIDNIWPISYKELIPYYEKAEATLPVVDAPITAKEELLFYGMKKAGFTKLKSRNLVNPGFRQQPNAILPVNSNINNKSFKLENKTEGCTLRGHCLNGCHTGPSIEKVAKRSTLVSYVPLALKTGNVTIRPNAFVIKVLTEKYENDEKAIGVRYRDTWTGEVKEAFAKVIVMSGGGVETPRLWLNSKLPYNSWVGKGLTNHWVDCISGIFDEKTMIKAIGLSEIKPYVGQTSAARLDYPGLGCLISFGTGPAIFSSLLYSISENGYSCISKKETDFRNTNRVVGKKLKEYMMDYPRTLSVILLTDDTAHKRNGITLDPLLRDLNGAVPVVSYKPSKIDSIKRNKLALIAADIMKKAGAKKVIRTNCFSNLFVHLESSMRMGLVTDNNCEALQVKRLFIADNSIHYNSLGGPNPTLTTQALAIRTSEKIADKYFG